MCDDPFGAVRRTEDLNMKVLYIALGVLSLPATLILSNLFWRGLREARCIAMLLSNRDFLRQVVTPDVVNHPSAEIARFARPVAGGYGLNMSIFRQAAKVAHSRLRAMLRPALAVVVVGSGVVGFLGVGWLGVALPIVNSFIYVSTFRGSTQGAIDNETTARAVEHVQMVAVILHRWHTKSPREAADWLESEPQMKPLWELLTTPQTQ